MASPDAPRPETRVYPPLPASEKPPVKEPAKADSISFVFTDRRHFDRPWTRLVAADLILDGKRPVLRFVFADLLALVTFVDAERLGHLEYWKTYREGRLSTIEEKAGLCQIAVKFQDTTDEFDKPYPPRPGGPPDGGGEEGHEAAQAGSVARVGMEDGEEPEAEAAGTPPDAPVPEPPDLDDEEAGGYGTDADEDDDHS